MIDAIHGSVHGVTYAGASTRIDRGFSITCEDGLRIYGVTTGDDLSVLGIDCPEGPKVWCESVKQLREIARTHELDLVHWCGCSRAEPDHATFGRLIFGELHER